MKYQYFIAYAHSRGFGYSITEIPYRIEDKPEKIKEIALSLIDDSLKLNNQVITGVSIINFKLLRSIN